MLRFMFEGRTPGHTLCSNQNVTIEWSRRQLCFVHGQGQKSEQKQKFVKLQNSLLTMVELSINIAD